MTKRPETAPKPLRQSMRILIEVGSPLAMSSKSSVKARCVILWPPDFGWKLNSKLLVATLIALER